MTGTIKVDTAKLRSTAGSLQGTGNQIKSLTGQMTSLVNALSGSVWEGDAAAAYRKKFAALQDDMNRMASMINEHVKDLGEMAAEYDKAESENRSATGGFSENIIS